MSKYFVDVCGIVQQTVNIPLLLKTYEGKVNNCGV